MIFAMLMKIEAKGGILLELQTLFNLQAKGARFDLDNCNVGWVRLGKGRRHLARNVWDLTLKGRKEERAHFNPKRSLLFLTSNLAI